MNIQHSEFNSLGNDKPGGGRSYLGWAGAWPGTLTELTLKSWKGVTTTGVITFFFFTQYLKILTFSFRSFTTNAAQLGYSKKGLLIFDLPPATSILKKTQSYKQPVLGSAQEKKDYAFGATSPLPTATLTYAFLLDVRSRCKECPVWQAAVDGIRRNEISIPSIF